MVKQHEASMAAVTFQLAGTAVPERVNAMARAAKARLTMISADGEVLADSEANPREMENHRTRPEFVDALNGKRGVSMRHSKTIGVNFL